MSDQNVPFKRRMRDRLRPVILTLDSLGATPLSVSVAGLVITAFSGLIVGSGHLFWGGIVFLLGSAFDMLDGDLARLQGTVSARGAFLDSCFDRLGEAFLLAGLTWHLATRGEPAGWTLVLIVITLTGSLTTSYVRARAEGVGETCFVGWLQRTERVILLVAMLLLGRWTITPVLAFLAVATMATTLQRLVHVAAKLPGPMSREPEEEDPWQ
ncbi:CDP-alcohol phosphatidyltransferase family protein [bacterium CG17_big_fil_post_rev_8_21_14_2_50_64_8]|nr:MAG: CDP-alcohol phosphatidyltransferase family protein [bacterium CG17_big_fil_post_rev_8_21_14_2_50_64_8]PJA77038.1 MAG: CDP-alcohol phosphatidyltransferase family protein [bacterium CG_4_9_14_3_um_filter_65_15]